MDAFTKAVKRAERLERARLEQEHKDLSRKLGNAVKEGTVQLSHTTTRIWRCAYTLPPIPLVFTTKVVFRLSDSIWETEFFTTDGERVMAPSDFIPVWTRSGINFLANEHLQATIDRMRQLLEPRRYRLVQTQS